MIHTTPDKTLVWISPDYGREYYNSGTVFCWKL